MLNFRGFFSNQDEGHNYIGNFNEEILKTKKAVGCIYNLSKKQLAGLDWNKTQTNPMAGQHLDS
jgi:hypothetical protein